MHVFLLELLSKKKFLSGIFLHDENCKQDENTTRNYLHFTKEEIEGQNFMFVSSMFHDMKWIKQLSIICCKFHMHSQNLRLLYIASHN